jgi:hypothetical protein
VVREGRRRVTALAAAGIIPEPWSVPALCANLADARGKPLSVCPLPVEASASGACGLWLAAPDADYLFVDESTTPLHRDHIVLHEVGHLVAGHGAAPGALPGVLPAVDTRTLLPDLSPELVRRILGRTTYTARQERVAETIADLLEATAGDRPAAPRAPTGIGRLEEALGASHAGSPA